MGLQIKNLFHLHTKMKSPETWQIQKALHHLPSFNGHHQLPRSQSQGIMLLFCPALPTESSMSRQLLLQNVSWSIHLSSLNPQFKLPSSFTGYRLSPNWSQCSAYHPCPHDQQNTLNKNVNNFHLSSGLKLPICFPTAVRKKLKFPTHGSQGVPSSDSYLSPHSLPWSLCSSSWPLHSLHAHKL